MVREVLPRVHIYSLALIVSAFHGASSSTVSTVDCTWFDIGELEDYLSKVHPQNLPAIDTMIGKFTSPVTELPFGALSSDWRRLLLLQRAQPEGSILKEKLGCLFRILAVAYFQTVEPSDITEPAIFSTTGSRDAFTSENIDKFKGDQEEAEKLGTPATDSTETNRITESFTSTNLPGLEEPPRVPEIGLTAADTTISYNERFDNSTNAIDSSSITSKFDKNYTIQSSANQNNIGIEKSLKNVKDFNNSASDENDSSDDSVNNRVDGYTPKVISSAASSAAEADGKRLDSSINPIDSSVITATSLTFDVNAIASSTTQSLAGWKSIGGDKRSQNFENINNPTFRNYDELPVNEIDGNLQQTDWLTTQQQINTFNTTASLFYTTTTSTNTRFSKESSTTATIERDRNLTDLKNINNSLVGKEDDPVELLEMNILNTTASPFYTTTASSFYATTASPFYTTTTSTNTRFSKESSTTATIERDRNLTDLKNINNSLVGKEDDPVELLVMNILNTTASPFYTTTASPFYATTASPFYTTTSTNTRFSKESSTTATIERDRNLTDLKNINNSLVGKEDDPVELLEMNILNTTASPFYTTTTSTNTRSSKESSTSTSIEKDSNLTNLKNINNSVVGKEDDLVESLEMNILNTTASPFDTMTSTNTKSSNESSTSATTIDRDSNLKNLKSINNSLVGKEDDPVESLEMNILNTTTSPFYTTTSTNARSSKESSAAIEGDESWEKVVTSEKSDSVNKHHEGSMAAVGKETVGSAKDGSSDHFRGAEVATAAAEAAVGGFVAGKSSVAVAIVEKDAQPITSPVSESDTPVTPFGSDFSTSRIRDYGTMNIALAALGIKESNSVVPTRTEISITRGRGDSPLAYTPMNSEDQEDTAEYRGTPNTSDPEMTDVKTTIEQSRVRTDRIPENEVPGDGSFGQQPVHQKDGGYSTHRSIQSIQYQEEIRKSSRKPKVDSEFSSTIVIPRIVASTTGSPSNRPDPQRDNRSRTGSVRSKKRGSLNTNIEKSFRWFYNADQDGGRGSDQGGIHIRCRERGHDHDNSV